MKIRELIEILKDIRDDEQEVYLSSDEEGNAYGELDYINPCRKCVILFPSGSYSFEEITRRR